MERRERRRERKRETERPTEPDCFVPTFFVNFLGKEKSLVEYFWWIRFSIIKSQSFLSVCFT